MFEQGELAQLTYMAFEIAAQNLQSLEDDKIEFSFPVGYKPDKTTLNSTRTYPKEELLSKYAFLASNQLSTNALVQLVTIVETMLGDLIRAVVLSRFLVITLHSPRLRELLQVVQVRRRQRFIERQLAAEVRRVTHCRSPC